MTEVIQSIKAKKKSTFFWKFSRDGFRSQTYTSLIIDVHDKNIHEEKDQNRFVWHTSFETLAMMLLLLQDVELLNELNGERNAGLAKEKYSLAVKSCGYVPSSDYQQNRRSKGLVGGQAVMGRHTGTPQDWGYYEDELAANNQIMLDVTDFEPTLRVDAKIGIHHRTGGRDLLSCYRKHPKFVDFGYYWDLMPLHKNVLTIFEAMKNLDRTKAEDFVQNVLLWEVN